MSRHRRRTPFTVSACPHLGAGAVLAGAVLAASVWAFGVTVPDEEAPVAVALVGCVTR